LTTELIIAVPGPWQDRKDFLTRVVKSTGAEFMLAGSMLANPRANDHIELELSEAEPNLRTAFEYAGHGKLREDTLDAIGSHAMVAYLHFPLAVTGQQQRLQRFTSLMRQIGGLAVKIESAGVAHEWAAWEEILASENPFDLYRGFVTLIGGQAHYYSCGMHHFALPEAQMPRSVPIEKATNLLNRFNFYRITESPPLASGHTFSLAADTPRYRLTLIPDERHDDVELLRNGHGVWDLVPTAAI
jgi:hypothetical protein